MVVSHFTLVIPYPTGNDDPQREAVLGREHLASGGGVDLDRGLVTVQRDPADDEPTSGYEQPTRLRLVDVGDWRAEELATAIGGVGTDVERVGLGVHDTAGDGDQPRRLSRDLPRTRDPDRGAEPGSASVGVERLEASPPTTYTLVAVTAIAWADVDKSPRQRTAPLATSRAINSVPTVELIPTPTRSVPFGPATTLRTVSPTS
jgi:hypothetical protein